jgi:ABC-2 type transport system ATP-binding protein
VRLELAEPPTAEALLPYGELERLEGRAATLLVPRDRLTTAVAALLARFAVVDLEVSDPPIEELIGGLFREGSTAGLAGGR